MNFCSRLLRLSVVPRCRERPQIAMCFLEWLGRLKWRATGLDASLSFFSTSRRCSRNRSPSRLPVSPMYNLLHNVQVMTFAEVHVKRSVILTDRLGPDILLVLTMKRQVLSALLTKKLPTFLSRLNEISGGCEKILPVSGSFWSNLKLLRMMLLTA